jgi:hypothetical protein
VDNHAGARAVIASAGRQGQSTRRGNAMTVIDTHTHYFPEEWVRLLKL